MTSTNGRPGDEEPALHAVLERIYTAWAAHDADAFVASYAADATATLPGSYLENREAIRTTMAAGFSGPLKGSRGVFEIRGVRVLAPGSAVINSTSEIVPQDDSPPAPGTRAFDTWMLTKKDGDWLVAAYHSSPAAAS